MARQRCPKLGWRNVPFERVMPSHSGIGSYACKAEYLVNLPRWLYGVAAVRRGDVA
jgi:hypothetical protein